MSGSNERDHAGKPRSGKPGSSTPERAIRETELERRRRELDAEISALRAGTQPQPASPKSEVAGFGHAMKLSSEFIAGVVVGGGLGWFIDKMAGTTPWGLIIFLLLGFGAGVLNVMRSAGLVAEQGIRTKPRDGESEK